MFKHIININAANDGLYSKMYHYINQLHGIIYTLVITKRLVFQNNTLL